MRKLLSLLGLLIISLNSFAQETGGGLDDKINDVFGAATGWFVQFIFAEINIFGVPVYWVLIPLVFGATWFTIQFAFPGIRLFGTAINTVRGKYDKAELHASDLNISDGDNPDTIRVEGEGEVSHFQALTAALSATVGLGNIAGVAVAIVIGGPGATFWMILCGLLGMSSKFVECTLGVKYREVDKNGKVFGGPMYYLSKGLSDRYDMDFVGKILAGIFAVMCIGGSFGGGNMFQANQAASIFMNSVGFESSYGGFLFGIVMAVLVGVVIIGGIKRIASVTEKIVPIMAGIYVLAALIIIVLNAGLIPQAFSAIFSQAFAPTAVAGGFLGVLVQGFRRAAFSNEAGIGSAAIAHSAVKTNQPASEGIVALLEPFIDTVVICTMTALVIVITSLKGEFALGGLANGVEGGGAMVASAGQVLEGVDLTSFAFNSAIPNFDYVLTIAVVLFAFSTMISWSYYGMQAWTYLFGRSKTNELVYKVLFCVFVVIGSASKMGNVLDFSDAMIFAMMVPNMIGLFLLSPVVREELKKYLALIKNIK